MPTTEATKPGQQALPADTLTALKHLQSLRAKATQGEMLIEMDAADVYAKRIKSGDKTIADVRFKNGNNDSRFFAASANHDLPGLIAYIERLEGAVRDLGGIAGKDQHTQSDYDLIDKHADLIAALSDAGKGGGV